MSKDKTSHEDKKDELKLPPLDANKRNRLLDRQSRQSFIGSLSKRPSTPDTAELSWSSNDSENLFPSLSYKRQAQQISHREQKSERNGAKLREKQADSTKLPPMITQKESMIQRYKSAIEEDKSILPPPPPSLTATPSKK